MNEPTKILRLIARLNIGGPAIQAFSLSRELSDNHYQTQLVCGDLNPGEGDMSYLAIEQGVQPHIIKSIQRRISLFGDLKSLWMIRKIIKHFQPQIIHTHTAKAGTLGRVAALTIGIPFFSTRKFRLVHTFHGHIFHSYFNPLKTFIFIQVEKMLGRFTDKIIVISEQQRKDICRKYKIATSEKVQTISLGFDLSNFAKIDRMPREPRQKDGKGHYPEPWRIGIVGRLTAVKNPFMLLDVINCLRLSGKIDRFKFSIIGDGELKKEFAEKAYELDLMNAIAFEGWRRNMPSVYARLDVVALTSKNEGTPVALIEAMASSRPVVATAVGGVTDLLGPVREKIPEGFLIAERGLMVESGDAEAMAQAFLYLSKNITSIQHVIRNAREFVIDKYDQDRLFSDIRILYRELLQR